MAEVTSKMDELNKPNLKLDVSIDVLHEGMQYMKKQVRDMELENKDCVIVIGASRSGKGTLISALKGITMK